MKDDDEAFIFRWFRTTNYFFRAEPRVSLVTPRKPLHLVNVTARRLFNDKMWSAAVGLLVQKAQRRKEVGSARCPCPACPEGGSLLLLCLAALNDHERVITVRCNHDLMMLRAQTQHLQLVLSRRTRASAVRDS